MKSLHIDGLTEEPRPAVQLAAGPVTLQFEQGDLRYLRLGETEILRRIYVAVRDRNWRTLEGRMSNLQIETGERTFSIRYTMEHDDGGIRFTWDAVITGDINGRIRFDMAGRAGSTFLTNRTGFCVLHPITPCAGHPCIIEHPDSSSTRGVFPQRISPHQPHKNIRAIRHEAQGTEVRVLMEGEVFEMEDQRNWSDGSYKTYCRPLELPYPYELKAGDQVRQAITIELHGNLPAATTVEPATPALDLCKPGKTRYLPEIGLVAAEGLATLGDKSVAALTSLKLKHLRLDVHLEQTNWAQTLREQAAAAGKICRGVEVAVYLPDSDAEAPLHELSSLWSKLSLQVLRWIILPQKGVTGEKALELARRHLAEVDEKAFIAAGTDAEFVAVNRNAPPLRLLEIMSFSLNPQVHAFDNASLVENLEAQSDVVASASQVSDGRPIAITPITLRRRFNPDATAPDALAPKLPASVDVRQLSLFAAAWTVGSLSHLVRADYLTYFETHGWRGVLQGDAPPPRPDLFPASAGDLFPVYHALKGVLSFGAENWCELENPYPLQVAALLLQKPGRQRLILANLTPRPLPLHLALPQQAAMTVLDAAGLESATWDTEYWTNHQAKLLEQSAAIELPEYAVAQVDWDLV
jgi:D-apionolactonase